MVKKDRYSERMHATFKEKEVVLYLKRAKGGWVTVETLINTRKA